MALLKVICWALVFIIRIRFPPGKSLVTIVNKYADWSKTKIPPVGALLSKVAPKIRSKDLTSGRFFMPPSFQKVNYSHTTKKFVSNWLCVGK